MVNLRNASFFSSYAMKLNIQQQSPAYDMHLCQKMHMNKKMLGVVAIEILLINVIFETSVYDYGKTAL